MLNKVQIIGRLGQKPELNHTKGGEPVCNLSLATNEYAGKGKEPETEWHRITLWGQAAAFAAEYLDKGDLAYVEGSLRTRKWQDKNGNDRETKEINSFTVKALGSKKDKGPAPQSDSGGSFGAEDIPF